MTDRKPMQLRIPADLKVWIKELAEKNGSSQNNEINRIIREKLENMNRAATEISRLEAELAASRASRAKDQPTT